MKKVILKPGKEKSLLRRHPWIFSGAIAAVNNDPQSGETVAVYSAKGVWLAWGSFSPASQIAVRVWSFDKHVTINSDFFEDRIKKAYESRLLLGLDKITSAYRIINGEADMLPGIIIDRYEDYFVCQFLCTGAEFWKETIVAHLKTLFSPTGIFERSDSQVRLKEGLSIQKGVLFGQQPPDYLQIREYDVTFLADINNGHKTGMYLDQRDNRVMLSSYTFQKNVLNCFSYTGGFGLWALKGQAAQVIHIDTSASALEIAREQTQRNGFPLNKVETICGDVFEQLRRFRDCDRRFDVIVLDPPKFAESVRQIPTGSRGYKDINLLAMKLLEARGILCTFSCSGHITLPLFQKIVSDAALDAHRQVQIIRYLHQAPDHPVALNYPESQYLKGLLCRVF